MFDRARHFAEFIVAARPAARRRNCRRRVLASLAHRVMGREIPAKQQSEHAPSRKAAAASINDQAFGRAMVESTPLQVFVDRQAGPLSSRLRPAMIAVALWSFRQPAHRPFRRFRSIMSDAYNHSSSVEISVRPLRDLFMGPPIPPVAVFDEFECANALAGNAAIGSDDECV